MDIQNEVIYLQIKDLNDFDYVRKMRMQLIGKKYHQFMN